MSRFARASLFPGWKRIRLAVLAAVAFAVYWFLPNQPRKLLELDDPKEAAFVGFIGDGSRLLVFRLDGNDRKPFRVIDSRSGELISAFATDAGNATPMRLLNEGKLLVQREFRDASAIVHLCSVETGKVLRRIEIPEKADSELYPGFLVFSNDGSRFAAHRKSGDVMRFAGKDEPLQGAWIINRFTVEVGDTHGDAARLGDGIFTRGRFSMDAARYAFIESLPEEATDGSFRVHAYEIPAGKRAWVSDWMKGGCRAIHFSPDGKWIVLEVEAVRRGIRFLDAETGTLMKQLDGASAYSGFRTDGKSFVSDNKVEGVLRAVIWDLETWKYEPLDRQPAGKQYYNLPRIHGSDTALPVIELRHPEQPDESGLRRLLASIGLQKKQEGAFERHILMDAETLEPLGTFECITPMSLQVSGHYAYIDTYGKGFQQAIWDIRPRRPWIQILAIWGLMLIPFGMVAAARVLRRGRRSRSIAALT